MRHALRSCRVAATLLALGTWSHAGADGETTYSLGMGGGPDGSPPPRFSTLIDLPLLFTNIGTYTAFPERMYGPGPWTNWYRETDLRKSLAKLATMRSNLESSNLWDTYRFGTPAAVGCAADAATTRTLDGTCNDLDQTWMGAVGTRFGRNVDPTSAAAQGETTTLLTPSPREISRRLFTRDEPKPVPFLNLLAAAWIQFNVHDWFNHDNSQLAFWDIPLAPDDPLRAEGYGVMHVPRTAPDPTRHPGEAGLAPTYRNATTHWWDGSQLYGSDAATAARLRTFSGGRLKLDAAGLAPTAPDGFEDTGVRANWWIGLGLMHNLFAAEHNAIADMLHARYPAMTDQQLFDKARMITAAVIVKIHTVEWTPAILPNPTLEVAMNINWYGLNKYLSPKLVTTPPYVPLPYRHVLFGIRGGSRELHQDPGTGADVPFALTEEFVSVYRMHPLLPDAVEVTAPGGAHLATIPLAETRNAGARALEEQYGLTTLMYSFGTAHPGGLVLDNYPALLQDLRVPFVGPLDIGAVDVLRDRERGVPRYNEFRRQLRLKPVASIDALTDDLDLRARLKAVYGTDAGAIERVDLLVGTLAEGHRPTCYGFGETLFQVFTLMASRRIHADRFYTESYDADTYTQAGLDWIEAASMKAVLLRHYPALAQTGLANVTNAFYPWS